MRTIPDDGEEPVVGIYHVPCLYTRVPTTTCYNDNIPIRLVYNNEYRYKRTERRLAYIIVISRDDGKIRPGRVMIWVYDNMVMNNIGI